MFDKYKLSDHKHQQIFEKICRGLFKNKTPALRPQIFILGGQPAAGKSILTQKVMKNFPDNNLVIVNADEFRLSHPQAKEIFNTYDKDFAQYTDPDVRLWGKEVFDAAIDGRYNIIFEGTMRTTQICDTILMLKAKGYQIHILAMAVPAIKSRISIYGRYQQQLENYPIARFTSRFAHDNAYIGMLDTLKKIENEHLFDTITICNRAGETVFQTGDQDIVSAVVRERNKPLSPQESTDLLKQCAMLLRKVSERGENPLYIEDIKNLQNEILYQNQQALKEKAFLTSQPIKQPEVSPAKTDRIIFSKSLTRSDDVS